MEKKHAFVLALFQFIVLVNVISSCLQRSYVDYVCCRTSFVRPKILAVKGRWLYTGMTNIMRCH